MIFIVGPNFKYIISVIFGRILTIKIDSNSAPLISHLDSKLKFLNHLGKKLNFKKI